MTQSEIRNYSNFAQSIAITGIIILGMILLSPINIILNKLIDKEASMLIYYLLAIGIPSWIVYSIRKRKTNNEAFNIGIENKWIIPLVIVTTVALLFGVITPIGSLIPMPEILKKALLDLAGQNGIFSFLLMVIAAPILEELLFRGIILDGIYR